MPINRNSEFKLPTPDEGMDGLARLVEIVGPDNFQECARWFRDNKNSTVTDFIGLLALREIEKFMDRNPDVAFDDARLVIAKRWGFFGPQGSNFTRYVERGKALVDDGDVSKMPRNWTQTSGSSR